jgi:hypothetical protein
MYSQKLDKTSQPNHQKNTPFQPRSTEHDQTSLNPIWQLHQTIGNRAVGRMIQARFATGITASNQPPISPIQRLCPECEEEQAHMKPASMQRQELEEEEPVRGIQAKLTMGSPGDVYEQEAEQVAEQVASFSNSINPDSIQQAFISGADISRLLSLVDAPAQRISQNANGARRLRINLHGGKVAQEDGTVPSSIERRILNGKGNGSPLPAMIRNMMALQTGYDFSNVKVKTDSEAADLNRSLNARAFTHGSDIWLGKNESVNDVRLMAHELTHVVQQGAAKRISHESLSGLEGIKSKSKVLSYLQALAKGAHYDASLFRKEIAQFQNENSAEKIAALQKQILEPSNGGDMQQQSSSKIMRFHGAPPSPAACACHVKSGPTYSPTGTIPVTTSGGRKSATFDMAAEFHNDTSTGKCPRCCEVRQYIKWDEAYAISRGGPPHSGFPSSATHDTWYEDRDTSDNRYGHRSGTHSDPIASCGDEYLTGTTRDQANGDKYCGKDSPGAPSSRTGKYNFQLKVIDTCNGNAEKASSSVITINW